MYNEIIKNNRLVTKEVNVIREDGMYIELMELEVNGNLTDEMVDMFALEIYSTERDMNATEYKEAYRKLRHLEDILKCSQKEVTLIKKFL